MLGDGVRLTDPESGRQTLQPGGRVAAVPDGPVVVAAEQAGRWVLTAHRAAALAWTRVLGPCPGGALPDLVVDDELVTATWPRRVERVGLATGAVVPAHAGPAPHREVGRAGDVVAVRTQRSLHTDPLRWGKRVTVIQLRDARTAARLGQVVSDDRLELLALDPTALVVLEGDRVVRYTLPR